MSKKRDEFAEGAVWACARLVEMYDQPTMADAILREGPIDMYDGIDYDREILQRAGISNTTIPRAAAYKRRPGP